MFFNEQLKNQVISIYNIICSIFHVVLPFTKVRNVQLYGEYSIEACGTIKNNISDILKYPKIVERKLKIKVQNNENDEISEIKNEVQEQKNNQEEYTIIFIPGYPGLIKYYDRFLNNLRDSLNIEIIAIGYINIIHYEGKTNQKYTVDENIQHKWDYISKLLKENPQRKFIFMGHSLGGHLVQQLMKFIPSQNIVKAYLIQPVVFGTFSETFHAKFWSFVYKNIITFIIYRIGWSFLAFIPTFIKKFILDLFLIDIVTECVLDCFTYPNQWIVTQLLQDLLWKVCNQNDSDIKFSIDKCCYIFSKNDELIPFKTKDILLRKFPQAECKIIKEEQMGHNFILKNDNSDLMSEYLVSYIKEIQNIKI